MAQASGPALTYLARPEDTPMADRLAAIVTGSTSGIGLAAARALAGAGCDVVINGFGDAAAIEKERAGIEADFKVTCKYQGGDLTKAADCDALVQACESAFGKVDVLVNNAGI